MHSTLKQLDFIIQKLNNIIAKKQLKTKPKIIVVTKTFPLTNILPLLDNGHIHYGENKIQEAELKWTEAKKKYKNLQLHMLGKLQTNKVKYVIQLFDYLHSLDNIKLAEKISIEQKKKNKKLKIFIQVNIGNEEQKNGIEISQIENFYEKCINDLELNIVGLMCLPPNNEKSSLYFSKMNELKKKLNLSELSMGMSKDYIDAIKNNSTFLRIGSKIFGKRN